MLNVRTLIAGLTLALSACTLGPTFKRPEPPATKAYLAPGEQPGAPSATPGSPSPGEFQQHIVRGAAVGADWWTVFDSPALSELVAMAVANNQTLASARASLGQAQELAGAAAGARYPQVSLNAGAGNQQYGAQFLGTFSVPAFSYVAVGAAVSYTLDFTGGIARTIEEQRALAQYQQSETQAVYLTLTGNVVMQAITVASTRGQIHAVDDLIAQDRDNLKLVQTEFDNGSASKVDVLTAQSQLASDQTLLPPLRQQLAVARHALALLVGRTPAEWTAPDFELTSLKLPRDLPLSLPSELVRHRPDILAAEAQLHAATAAVGVATANLYPQITLSATLGQQALANEADQLFNSANTAWTLISGITAPVFKGGTLRAERRAAVDALRASSANYKQTVLVSFVQVADLLDALDHDAELLAAQSSALGTARSNTELARESYRVGYTGLLQVVDAQRLLLTAQLGLLRAEAQQYVDTVQLYLALGGGELH
ncbi:MAG TPA: efflux transporter outer membrane subunit [Steroidobacteraceae bacterium]|nr:efflux transporter outer membrane subunit [Steroidobacteraceae bacterium]